MLFRFLPLLGGEGLLIGLKHCRLMSIIVLQHDGLVEDGTVAPNKLLNNAAQLANQQ